VTDRVADAAVAHDLRALGDADRPRAQDRHGVGGGELGLDFGVVFVFTALMVALARRNNFPWDAILGSEIAGDFKPKPRVYLRAAEAFDCEPGECIMVAAHSGDLAAAAKTGLKTAHVARPNEHGPGKGETKPSVPVDVAVASFTELADKLGA